VLVAQTPVLVAGEQIKHRQLAGKAALVLL
jgi:hypothetical protein